MEHNNSIVLVTSYDTLHSRANEISDFFQSRNESKKDLVLFHHLPITDYTSIKKIPAENVIIIYKKDFIPLLNLLKSNIKNTLQNYSYTYLIHYNTHPQSFMYTSKIAQHIFSEIKISDRIQHKKNFHLIFPDSNSYLPTVSEYMNKIKT
ncbi:MAG: hypothetical protein KatS3mg027_0476 [Bacteroidia bacterium]|nr:MAG: hypothetical protein KatS3mg027_0476 [Bacteroidia bacterium]